MNVQKKVEAFFSNYKLIRFNKKALIIRAEEEPQGVYYLKSGFVRMYVISEDGKEITVNFFKPGSFFSMIWALTGKTNYYFFEAMTPVETYRTSRKELVAFLDSNSKVERDLLIRILKGLDCILIRMEYLLVSDAYKKIAVVLGMLAVRYGEENKQGHFVVSVPMTHQEVANLVGMARETASIQLKKMKDRGLIDYAHKTLTVKDLDRLREESLIYCKDEPLPSAF
ncbi:Crp/Fnr family transcriptional regulator [Patescibacteria group bacterium]|nr:Crp/Fnr family transcriptional regulator [Patescibacteria group bacterium]